jgi:hypothetical protein
MGEYVTCAAAVFTVVFAAAVVLERQRRGRRAAVDDAFRAGYLAGRRDGFADGIGRGAEQ